MGERQRQRSLALENPESFLGDLGLACLRPSSGDPAHGPPTPTNAWSPTTPAIPVRRLEISVEGHRESENRCTLYAIVCTLKDLRETSPSSTWRCERRLCEIREELLDVVTEGLGPAYAEHFEKTPFALRLAPPGTTERLRNWFNTLAVCVTDGRLQPRECAIALSFLGLTAPSEQAERAAPSHGGYPSAGGG